VICGHVIKLGFCVINFYIDLEFCFWLVLFVVVRYAGRSRFDYFI